MRKISLLMATLVIAGCAAKYDNFIYEVTRSDFEEVRVQTHKGALNMAPEEVSKLHTHMQNLADAECVKHGGRAAKYKTQRQYTTGAYYSWVEKIYTCR